MHFSRNISLALALAGLAAIAPPAKATTLTGLSDFNGVKPVHVGYDPLAPEGNFQAGPVPVNKTVAYNVYLKGDASNIYGLVDSLPSAANGNDPGPLFANLYLSTNPTKGTNVGFEVTSNRAFVPGQSGYFDLSSTGYTTFTGTDGNGGNVIEFAVPFTFFTTDPLNMGFDKLQPGGTFQIRDSQSFGYTYVGGAAFGSTRLGQITYNAPSAAPEPSQFAGLGFTAFGALGLVLKARKRQKPTA